MYIQPLKNKRECLYSVKSSIGTEPTERKLAHSRLNQFGNEVLLNETTYWNSLSKVSQMQVRQGDQP